MTIYRMIRTVGITDAQEQLNDIVRCLEKGDHVYIQDIDPLTPDYELPEVTPDEYKSTLKKYYGNRLLKDHWNGFTQWDYYYLKEEPKPKPMEYPPEYIDTENETKKAETQKPVKNGKTGKKKMSFFDIFLASNKRVKKEPVQETKPEEPKRPEEPPKVTFAILNEEPEPEQPVKERKARRIAINKEPETVEPVTPEPVIPEPEPVTEKPPKKATQKKTTGNTRKPRTPKAKQPMNTEDMEKILRYDEEMEKKIQSMTENFEGKKKEE